MTRDQGIVLPEIGGKAEQSVKFWRCWSLDNYRVEMERQAKDTRPEEREEWIEDQMADRKREAERMAHEMTILAGMARRLQVAGGHVSDPVYQELLREWVEYGRKTGFEES